MSNQQGDNIPFAYDDEAPTIEEDELADVKDDVDINSHGASNKNNESNEKEEEDTTPLKQQSWKQGQPQEKTACNRKTCLPMVLLNLLVLLIVLIFVIPASRKVKDKSVDQKLQEEGTPWGFDESDEYNPLASLAEIAEAGVDDDDWYKKIMDTALELLVPFPVHLEKHFKNVGDGVYDKNTETPFFFQVPNSGSTMQSLLTACNKLILASNTGDEPFSNPPTLEKVVINKHEYVNVNLGRSVGIAHAADLGLVESGLADVIVSHHLHYAGKMLFDPNHQGRAFTMLRHPIERSLATYHALKSNPPNAEIANMTLSDYIHSEYAESNWLTRFLTNRRRDGVLGYEQVAVAKELLRRKFLVGLYDSFEESVMRMEKYFGWEITEPEEQAQNSKTCHTNLLSVTRKRDKADFLFMDTQIKYGDLNYQKLKALNQYDLEVYWYAVQLFKEQELFLKHILGHSPK